MYAYFRIPVMRWHEPELIDLIASFCFVFSFKKFPKPVSPSVGIETVANVKDEMR